MLPRTSAKPGITSMALFETARNITQGLGSDQTAAQAGSYQESIPTSSLPRTIRDAISLSKSLGLSYLWVDSMCIIQDSTVHKQEEIGRMGAMYYNAYVVISAASAATCKDGLLQERDLSPRFGSFRIPFGADGIAFLTPKLCINKLPIKEENPLDNRAWTYQEMFIARRIIVFTSYGVTWNCVQTSGTMGHRSAGAGFEYVEDTCRQPLENPELNTWCFIVEKFSKRNLTRDSDKLPALSSIARLFDQGRDSVYLAGIWVWGGTQLLTWGTAPQFDRNNAPSRPGEWRAPSWSYLSINGPFGFNGLDGGQTSEEWKGMGWTAWDFHTDSLDPNNPYGEVKSCGMTMKCRMMEVRVKEKGRQDTDRSYSLQRPGRSMALEELKLEDEVKLSGEANTPSPGSPSVFQWSETRPYIRNV